MHYTVLVHTTYLVKGNATSVSDITSVIPVSEEATNADIEPVLDGKEKLVEQGTCNTFITTKLLG